MVGDRQDLRACRTSRHIVDACYSVELAEKLAKRVLVKPGMPGEEADDQLMSQAVANTRILHNMGVALV